MGPRGRNPVRRSMAQTFIASILAAVMAVVAPSPERIAAAVVQVRRKQA